MKNVLKTLVLGLGAFCSIQTSAQVGIGTNTPHPRAILDLTNTNQKVLVLPTLSAHPIDDTTGMMYYSTTDSVTYFHDGLEFNGVSPWKYNYGTSGTDYLYYNPTSFKGVGIGLNNPTIGNLATIQISSTGREVSNLGTSASIFIGEDDNSNHLIFDNDEILAKSSPTTGGLLKLQEEDGSLRIGSDRPELTDTFVVHLNSTIGSPSNQKSLNVNGRMKEFGNDLLPAGTIVMWSGNTAPAGWALCDGGSYTLADGSGNITVPDLRGKFIAGYDATDTDYNNANTGSAKTGGSETSSHTHNVNPASFQTPAGEGTHSHSGTTGGPSGTKNRCACAAGAVGDGSHTHNFTTAATQGAHQHTIDVPNTTSGGASNTENRPPYYTLAFIFKL